MTAAIIKHFDALDYVDRARALGVHEDVAKYQARQFEQAIDIAVKTARVEIENKELATKKDIEQVKAEIHKSKFEMVVWVAGLLIASGLIQHFFK